MSNRKKLLIRIFALILALLMIGGTVVAALYSSVFAVSAADYTSQGFVSDQKTEKYVACGLMYGTDVTVGFETSTTYGFIIGSAHITDTRSFQPLWKTNTARVSVTSDANLSKNAMTYSISSGNNVVIGGYHVELSSFFHTQSEVEYLVSQFKSALSSLSYSVFPAYVNETYRIRIGDFSTQQAAEAAILQISALIGGYSLSVAVPSISGVSLVNPITDEILFEYSNGDRNYLGLSPIQSGSSSVYTKTPAGNIYPGIFCYGRYRLSSTDGVTVINLLHSEDYIKGVLPWEISASWPMELQKAFAITTRSFTYANMKRHYNTYGFDLCNSTHCQAYLGYGRTNNNVIQAVDATKNLVLHYNNKIVSAFYHSTAGGETIQASEAWGGPNPGYSVSQQTPWEKYTTASNGIWTAEVSPSDLYSYLKNIQGYTELNSEISRISIDELSGNTEYVKKLTIYDSNGGVLSLSKTDTVRGSLTKYLKSPNFVVGKGSVERTYARVISVKINDNSGSYKPPVVVEPDEPTETNTDLLLFNTYVMSGVYGLIENPVSSSVVISSNGKKSRLSSTILTSDGYAVGNKVTYIGGLGSTSYRTSVTSTNGPITVTAELEIITETVYASNPNNFIFAGKGWGHGVGLSQSGAKDLADLGVKAEPILQAYFHGTSVTDFRQLP